MIDLKLVVNAGGDSRRMHGRTKALLPVPPTGKPLIARIIERLAPLATSGTLVVANDPAVRAAVAESGESSVDVVPDRWPGAGPISGIATALSHCDDWALVVACDMPFVNRALFASLSDIAVATDDQGRRLWDAVVPRVRGYAQTLHALYHADMLSLFEEMIEAGNYKLLDVLPRASVRYVEDRELGIIDPELRSFINVNTYDEWHRALRLLNETAGTSN